VRNDRHKNCANTFLNLFISIPAELGYKVQL
jgi:hypothetical protein